jgi:hypothetical protein
LAPRVEFPVCGQGKRLGGNDTALAQQGLDFSRQIVAMKAHSRLQQSSWLPAPEKAPAISGR